MDHRSFYTRYVTNGTPEDIAELKSLLKELAGTDNLAAIPNAERKVFEKKIDDGLVHMLQLKDSLKKQVQQRYRYG